jgi:hypothetical protein
MGRCEAPYQRAYEWTVSKPQEEAITFAGKVTAGFRSTTRIDIKAIPQNEFVLDSSR